MLTSHAPRARRAASGLLAVVLLTLPTAAQAAVPSTADPSGACTDPQGVTVVVDLTDLGGAVEVGCALDAATGTEALQAAGFTETRDAASMICAIDGAPDPCPETFEGSFWSYWFAAPDGQWESYLEGSDVAVPVAGHLEGWRYSDGTAGPTVEPAAVIAAAGSAATAGSDEAAETDQAEDGSAATDAAEPADAGPSPAVLGGLGLLAVLAAAAVLVGRRRLNSFGPPGQD
ncbi:hypothetical protein [Cellulomonas sp. KRMCY2]|uniref:hypothetical protein n=1 Tax=Cellulomonas sp. KRMCY2 TaxID=1304865 RepID=UPI00045EBF01|nr:hypothetical protein [Cellulomonas sp. KRMCY2]